MWTKNLILSKLLEFLGGLGRGKAFGWVGVGCISGGCRRGDGMLTGLPTVLVGKGIGGPMN